MTEWELLSRYNYFKLKAEDRRAFDRWQRSAAVTASLFALALLAMAANAWLSPNPAPTMMAGRDVATTDGMAIRDITTRVGPELTVQETEDPL